MKPQTCSGGRERLFSLDLLRGLDMFYLACGGVLVPAVLDWLGAPPEVRRFLCQHPWRGFTLYDLIMPLFIFMCGAAVPFALGRRLVDGRPGPGYWRHVWGRVALLWVLGMLAQGGLATLDMGRIGFYTNTLQTIAVGYLAAAFVLPVRSWRVKAAIPVALVVAYGLIVHFCGDYTKDGNISQKIDLAVWGAIMPAGNTEVEAIRDNGYSWLLPSMMFPVITLAGCYATQMLRSGLGEWRKAAWLAAFGAGSLAAGWILYFVGVEMVKHIFTVSFTLQAIGWSIIALDALYVATDILKFRRGTGLFILFGQFALTAYLCESVFRTTVKTASDRLFAGFERFFPPDFAPVVKAVGFSVVVTLVLLARRRMSLSACRRMALLAAVLVLPGRCVAASDACVPVKPASVVGELPRLSDASLDVFLDEVYGRRPVERPTELSFADLYPPEVFERAPKKGIKRKIDALRKIIVCRYRVPYAEDHFRFVVFIPKDAKKPVPAFVFICNRNTAHIDPWRDFQSEFWPAEQITDRGYAAIAFWNDSVAVDCYDEKLAFKAGVFRCFEDPSKSRADNAWGALSAWAWGASRIMDWIETEPLIDASRVAVVGHSRCGKAALVAGVTDRRFALAVANGSGCGGAKLNHTDLPKSEHVRNVYHAAPYWFCRNFAKYSDKDTEMPFDQHQLISLIAPRLVYVASGSEDHWAGPEAERLGVELARPAWGERGALDVGYHAHEGRHSLSLVDWNKFMDFTDAHGWRDGR